tara:strand:+ start:1002 stop:2105 length:1104 start_codon:yes stop_codon:yes gene_type:complete
MKNTILAVIMIIALASCQSNKKEESTKTEQVATTQIATTENAFFAKNGRIITPESYPTDETSRQILKSQDLIGVNNFNHKPQLTPTDKQPVVRMNRDTYYSMAVIDVSKGASITMPEIPEGKYMSIQPVTEDHRIQAMKYGAGTFDLTTHTGTHLYVVVRLDATFTEAEAKEIHDKMSISANSDNSFTTMPVDEESFTAVENALKAKMTSVIKRDGVDALKGMFTDPRDSSNELFTQEKYELGAALGWGGAQMIDNIYELSENYSADHCYQLTFEDPENLAFWSITVYDKKGFMFNDLANFSSNKAQANADGTYTVSFGCGADAPNNMEIANPSGVFNIAVRHYQPSKRVFDDDYRLIPFMKVVSNE